MKGGPVFLLLLLLEVILFTFFYRATRPEANEEFVTLENAIIEPGELAAVTLRQWDIADYPDTGKKEVVSTFFLKNGESFTTYGRGDFDLLLENLK